MAEIHPVIHKYPLSISCRHSYNILRNPFTTSLQIQNGVFSVYLDFVNGFNRHLYMYLRVFAIIGAS